MHISTAESLLTGDGKYSYSHLTVRGLCLASLREGEVFLVWLFLLGICGVLFKFISSFFLVLYSNVLLSRWREYLLSALLGFFFGLEIQGCLER